ncbi:MAG: endonuclease/exonuclease/phosphatase family protein [Elainella sp. Prado103]|nr:endonuclease/exonuclease/phosphatase family protein [Elainella sp. Prado103]
MNLLKLLAILVAIPATLLVLFFWWASAGSYPRDQYSEIVSYPSESAAVSELVNPAINSLDNSLDNSPDNFPSTLSGASSDNSGGTFTLIAYNIGYLSGLANAAGENRSIMPTPELFARNLKVALSALQAEDPDLIALQEIDLQAKRSYNLNQVAALAQPLGLPEAAIAINWDKNYVPFPLWPISEQFGRTVAGQAILSRFPIQSSERIVLEPVASQPFYYRAFYLDRLAQVAEIAINGQSLIVINVHLEAFDEPTRTRQTQVVKDLAERYATNYPVLLVGDFNSAVTRETEQQPSINLLLKSKLRSAQLVELAEPAQFTFPSNAPADALDYVFYTPDQIEPVEARVVTAAGQASDHLPLLFKFRFRSPSS